MEEELDLSVCGSAGETDALMREELVTHIARIYLNVTYNDRVGV